MSPPQEPRKREASNVNADYHHTQQLTCGATPFRVYGNAAGTTAPSDRWESRDPASNVTPQGKESQGSGPGRRAYRNPDAIAWRDLRLSTHTPNHPARGLKLGDVQRSTRAFWGLCGHASLVPRPPHEHHLAATGSAQCGRTQGSHSHRKTSSYIALFSNKIKYLILTYTLPNTIWTKL